MSRLHAHSSNYDMDLTLDYNTELYPLKMNESFSLVLASSLARGNEAATTNGVDGAEEKESNVWRPDGKGRRGLEEDYEYVMYGRVRWNYTMLMKSRLNECRCINSMVQPRILCMRPVALRVSVTLIAFFRTAYISFGGLLMSLTGSYRHMTGIVLNEPVYLLLRR